MARSNSEIRPLSAPEAPLRIVLVVEAPADARVVSALIDKVLLEHKASPYRDEAESLSKIRTWVDLSQSGYEDIPHVTWTWLKSKGVRVNRTSQDGLFDYTHAARRALATVADRINAFGIDVDAVVLVVDSDGDPDRRQGLDRGHRAAPFNGEVFIGVPIHEREAWVLNAFEATSTAAKAELKHLYKELRINCIEDAHELTGKDGAPDSCKSVLERLLSANDTRQKRKSKRASARRIGREQVVISNQTLSILHKRGAKSGLADFLVELEALLKLLPPATARTGTQ